jgi:DNA uptake protein ComE-like DNA-binding protein
LRKATIDEIADVAGIGPVLAEQIVANIGE